MLFILSSRILSAGGAEIALGDDDLSNLDFVITTKEMFNQIKTKVSNIIPHVDVSYIKKTLLLVSSVLFYMYVVHISMNVLLSKIQ